MDEDDLERKVMSEERLMKLADIKRNQERDKKLDLKRKMSIIENEMEHEILNKASKAYRDLNREQIQEDAIQLQHNLRLVYETVDYLHHQNFMQNKQKEKFIKQLPFELNVKFGGNLP